MRKSLVLAGSAFISAVLFTAPVYAQHSDYKKIEDGVIVYPAKNNRAVKLEVISDKIFHITVSPSESFTNTQSLIIADTIPFNKTHWTLTSSASEVVVHTGSLDGHVSLPDGKVSFTDKAGKSLLAGQSRSFTAGSYQGDTFYQLTQVFTSNADEAYYGLGQHQSGVMNYKGHEVTLLQNNTEVAVPFLLSNKNYGILWDNYSITKVGDGREAQALSGLKLYSEDGNSGWLTATYSYKNNPAKAVVKRPESDINYPFLSSMKNFPDSFKLGRGIIRWQGDIESGYSGKHQFLFKYAGYIKVWINGKLLADRWRQAWNPGNFEFDYDLEKGKKYAFKIEWTPDGNESYIAVSWLPPSTEKQKKQLVFNSEAGDAINYYFISGNTMDEIISGYRGLTGRAPIMPKWAFGFWQSRERYKSQEEILSAVKEFRSRKIPLDNIVLDWSYWPQDQWGSQDFDKVHFPAPEKMVQSVHADHVHFMISVWPKFYEGIDAYNEFNKNGWLYKRNIAEGRRDWIGKGYHNTFYDPYNPDARKAFWNLIDKKLYSKGVDAWWMDASEPDIHSNLDIDARKTIIQPSIGSSTRYFNTYPLLNAKGIYEGQRAANPDSRVFILTRSSFAGQQRYAAATWSGDIASRWHDMKDQISACVNFSMSGIPYWTMDIGGFAVERRYENAKGEDLDEWRELNTRWYQFGAFVPLFRVHGQYPYREIYNIAPKEHPAYQSMLYYDELRYRMLPYIYSLGGSAYLNNYTIMRGLVMDFPSDTAVNNINDQFMLGPSLLVNPVCEYKALSRKVYLPAQTGWFDLYSGKYFKGGRSITAAAPYNRMPVFVKEGSILPFGPALQYTSQKPADPVTLYVYTGKDASFSLYEDEGTNYNYEKGSFSIIPLSYDEASHTLTIGERKGTFNGMLKSRTFKVVWVSAKKPHVLEFDKKADGEVRYNGKTIKIKMH